MWRNWNPRVMLVGMQNGTAASENSIVGSQKTKNRNTIWPINSTSGYIPEIIENWESKGHLYINAHGSIIHSSRKVEVTQMFINGWMDKQNVVDTHNGILSSLKQEGNSDMWYDVDKP